MKQKPNLGPRKVFTTLTIGPKKLEYMKIALYAFKIAPRHPWNDHYIPNSS